MHEYKFEYYDYRVRVCENRLGSAQETYCERGVGVGWTLLCRVNCIIYARQFFSIFAAAIEADTAVCAAEIG